MASTYQVGHQAETAAVKYFKKLGWQLLETNFKIKDAEIDLIFKHQQKYIFVEVKARFTHKFGLPAEAISPHKIKRIAKAAEIYLHLHHLTNNQAQIDALTLDYTFKPVKITHYQNIGQLI